MAHNYGYAKAYGNCIPMGMKEAYIAEAEQDECPICNGSGVRDWGPVNAKGRNDQIKYCNCPKGREVNPNV